jgi:hypothetical protein
MAAQSTSTTPNGQAPERNPYVLVRRQPPAKASVNAGCRDSRAYIATMNDTATTPKAVSIGSKDRLVKIRDRELRRVPVGTLLPNPKNWRRHPPAQADALRGILGEVGFAEALLVCEKTESLQFIDGHFRAEGRGAFP